MVEDGSIAVHFAVEGRRAADSANMPPPQPTSRYVDGDPDPGEARERDRMKSCRRGFIRCKGRDGP